MTPRGTKNDTHILATSESQDVNCNGNENKQTTDIAPDTQTDEPVETAEAAKGERICEGTAGTLFIGLTGSKLHIWAL